MKISNMKTTLKKLLIISMEKTQFVPIFRERENTTTISPMNNDF